MSKMERRNVSPKLGGELVLEVSGSTEDATDSNEVLGSAHCQWAERTSSSINSSAPLEAP